MSLHTSYQGEGYVWGIWKADETIDHLNALLPDQGKLYAEELSRFKRDHRKREYLAVRVLIYTLLGKEEAIGYQPDGKPYFVNGKHHLSISHTADYVCAILSEKHEVGIDIERVADRVHRVAHKFVRPDEPLPEDPASRTTALLLIWSAKETMFKCIHGEGIDFREHLFVDTGPAEPGLLIGQAFKNDRRTIFRIHYRVEPDFVLTWTAL